MYRNVTAIYRTHATAELVRREIDELGLAHGHVHVIPNRDEPVGAEGQRTDDRYMDTLHDLHLPDDDLRTYQHSVRRGDYVVSVEVDEEHVGRVQQIMRRPEEEAHNLDTRESEFRGEELYPHSAASERTVDQRRLGRRDPAWNDPYSRTYHRDDRLDDLNRR